MKQIFKNIIVAILMWEARLVIKKYKPRIVGVTGSVGKTSTKDAIYSALATKFRTGKSEKSFNSEIGIPLTILRLPNAYSNPIAWLITIIEGLGLIIFNFSYPEWLVLEIGADKPGDIKSVTEWLKPDVAVITRFGDVPVHIEFFPSIEDLINEKGALARAVKPHGVLVLNADDHRVTRFGEEMKEIPDHTFKEFTYGFSLSATVRGVDEQVVYAPSQNSEIEFPEGMRFTLSYGDVPVEMYLHGGIGRQHIYPILAAAAVGLSQGISLDALQSALQKHLPPPGRMHLVAGIKDTMILDDTYNASPVAVAAALDALKSLKVFGKKIAVLGDMLELGEYSVEEHKKVGKHVAQVADILVAIGVRARGIADAALDAGMSELNVLQFDSSREAGKYLETIIKEGDIILAKGSQSIRVERVVEEIMAKPEDKENLLVRQDSFWLAKK